MNIRNYPPLMQDPVHAGFPSPAEHYIERELDLNEYLSSHREATYYVRVTGDSMIGADILPGDILCVDRSIDFFDGAIIVASVDGEFTVKYLRKQNGIVHLEPANPHYPPLFFTPQQDVRFWGVVTGVVRKIRYSRCRHTIPEPAIPVMEATASPRTAPLPRGRRERYQKKLSPGETI